MGCLTQLSLWLFSSSTLSLVHSLGPLPYFAVNLRYPHIGALVVFHILFGAFVLGPSVFTRRVLSSHYSMSFLKIVVDQPNMALRMVITLLSQI